MMLWYIHIFYYYLCYACYNILVEMDTLYQKIIEIVLEKLHHLVLHQYFTRIHAICPFPYLL
jgi:hypothetical protein